MMKRHLLLLVSVITSLSFIGVRAQQDSGLPHLQANDLKQFPSVIEISGTAVGGAANTQFILRCGYVPNGTSLTSDATLNDLSLLNVSTQSFTRYQNIDGKPVISTLDSSTAAPMGARQVLSQVTEPDGSTIAKSCAVNVETDTPLNCTRSNPFLTAGQAQQATQAVEAQCQAFLQQALPQIQGGIYDAQKTQDWKTKLQQTMVMLEQ